jgi:hypothetical protein
MILLTPRVHLLMLQIQVMQDVLRAGGDVTEVAVGECWGSTSTGTLLDTKPPGAVVLHDRLMTDAALGAVPIKTEHSYSLTSDGDSMPESPISLETMDDGEYCRYYMILR